MGLLLTDATLAKVPLAVLSFCAEQIGRQAVEQMIWRLDQPESPPVSVSLQP